jgi:hypothetical protein
MARAAKGCVSTGISSAVRASPDGTPYAYLPSVVGITKKAASGGAGSGE